MSKTEADGIKKIETSFLKKNKYLNGWRSGTVTWTHGWSGNKSSVGIEVSTLTGDNYLRIHYTQTDTDTEEKKDFDYKIPLVTTPCRYGGKRYWFICPMSRDGKYCGRRVGVLYKDGDYFACRHCNDLTYESRKLSGRAKSFGRIISIPEIEKMRDSVKRTYYRGKPTKRYLRYLQMDEKARMSLIGMVGLLEARSNKVQKNAFGRKNK